MKSEKINSAIDMTICMAITDYAKKHNISEETSRNKIMASKSLELFYDESTNLWTEGPDSLISLIEEEQ